jgi:hypothetical protein
MRLIWVHKDVPHPISPFARQEIFTRGCARAIGILIHTKPLIGVSNSYVMIALLLNVPYFLFI